MPSAMNERTVAELEKLLRYIAANLKQRGREILTNYPITPPQFVALQWLLEEGDLTVGELSNKMYLACSTTTDLVDRMERNGLVARVRDEHDRRVVRIRLLEKGERIIEEVIEKRQRDLANVLESFSDEEIVVFERCLRKLHQEMTKE
ncbi:MULTISPECIES: MarR family winged helix-turn-helix transcriptional regulator [Geobacillus]|uniref:MarR family winged helix-turn-helix transcriptional regulator n=2 Tax=Geobacillus TaxID=129337 RepID=A0ABV6GT79_9BACL|nr:MULTISPECIES: MarR family transcriptional regulator [Geobacillus]ADI25867.1 transcriptional regulator, MarR family [Geobacillus sp. C56-T3]ADU95083.1 transcriptional regulator, MarR family [Geobacillus sp. Y412MC52]ALA69605.1 MarR family transcriptional regulator [Geobacillus stearothermophilus 10]